MDILDALAEGNAQYEKYFSYIFLVCASGKTAEEMLCMLNERMSNAPLEELRVAAGEQAKITTLRVNKLLDKLTRIHIEGSHL